MWWETVLTIVFAVLTACGGVYSYYLHVKNNLTKQALTLINDAEDTDLVGTEKMTLVIAALQDIIPGALKPLFPESVLEGLVQMLFDEVENFAKKQM